MPYIVESIKYFFTMKWLKIACENAGKENDKLALRSNEENEH